MNAKQAEERSQFAVGSLPYDLYTVGVLFQTAAFKAQEITSEGTEPTAPQAITGALQQYAYDPEDVEELKAQLYAIADGISAEQ